MVLVLQGTTDQSVLDSDEVVRISGFPVLSAIPMMVKFEDKASQRCERILGLWGTVLGIGVLLLSIHFFLSPLDLVGF